MLGRDKTRGSSSTARRLGRSSKGQTNLAYYFKKLTGQRTRKRAVDSSSKLKKTPSSKQHKKLSAKEARRRAYLATMPRNPIKRFFWRLHPKRFASEWFNRYGAIRALKIFGAMTAIGIVLVGGIIVFYASQLEDPREINSRVLSQTTQFYDRTGKKLLFEAYGDEKRTVVDVDEISPHLQRATIAVEDKDFYDHGGFSVEGIVRAFFNNLRQGEVSQGGSTITQQYIKLALLTNERSYERKIKELILAVQVERLYTKDEILGLYLNQISYGGFLLGAETASQEYFGKPAAQLSLDESAFLAGIPQKPGVYNPCDRELFDEEGLTARQDTILDLMVEQDYIKKEDAEKAKEVDTVEKVNCNFSRYADAVAPHFVTEVQKQLTSKYTAATVNQGGFKVITTLDLETQKVAEQVVKRNLYRVTDIGGDNMALVAGDHETGQILAMVGSRDFDHPKYGSFNVATAQRQPGSSFKPFEYAALFETNEWGAGSVMYDVRTDFGGGYTPKNFDGGYQGAMSIRKALTRSRNIPAVKAMYIAGENNVLDLAASQGLSNLDDRSGLGLSAALGSKEVKLVDMVTAYGTFAAGGIHHEQTYILKVTNAQGEVLEEYEEDGERVLSEQSAFLISDILGDRGNRFGVLNGTTMDAPAKTGTTDAAKDVWTMGYSKKITAGVWGGTHDNKKMGGSSGNIAPAWVDFMNSIHAKKKWKNEEFKRPKGLKSVTLDSHTGRAPTDKTKARHSDLFPSAYKAPKIDDSQKFEIDSISGDLATACTPEYLREEVTIGGMKAEIPEKDPAFSRWNPPVQALAKSLGVSGLGSKPTKEDSLHKCSDTEPIINNFPTPVNVGGNVYKVEVTVSKGTHNLTQIDFKLDGKTKSSQSISSSGGTYSAEINAGSNGSHKFTVVVTDKAGYRTEASQTVNASYSSDLTADDAYQIGPSSFVRFEWNKDSAANKYVISWSGPKSGSKTVSESGSGSEAENINFNDYSMPSGTYSWTISSYYNSHKLDTKSGPSFSYSD